MKVLIIILKMRLNAAYLQINLWYNASIQLFELELSLLLYYIKTATWNYFSLESLNEDLVLKN